jgi:hypothetical protein
MGAGYYRHSGRFSVPRLALVVAVTSVVAVVLAFVYAYAFAYIPIIGYVSFLLAIGFGFTVGFVASKMAIVGHARSSLVAILVTVLAMAVGYYVSWSVWLHAIAGRSEMDLPISELATSPSGMWALIRAINETGVWTMHGFTPKGGVLWLFWGLEVAFIFVPAVYAASTGVGRTAYCEACGRWCVDRAPIDLGIADITVLGHELEAGNLQALAELPPRGPDELVWTRVEVKVCPDQDCGRTNTLSLSTVALVADDEGNVKEKVDLDIDRLLIDRATAAQLAG